MPRPKGSKNKPKIQNVDEKITAAEAEVAALTEQLKAKKAELKKLMREKAKEEKRKAAMALEEEKAVIMDAVKKSGKSLDEILDMLKD